MQRGKLELRESMDWEVIAARPLMLASEVV